MADKENTVASLIASYSNEIKCQLASLAMSYTLQIFHESSEDSWQVDGHDKSCQETECQI